MHLHSGLSLSEELWLLVLNLTVIIFKQFSHLIWASDFLNCKMKELNGWNQARPRETNSMGFQSDVDAKKLHFIADSRTEAILIQVP